MAVTPKAYGLMLNSLWEGRINLAIDPLMCMLVDADYTPNQDTHKFRSVVTNEIVASGYAGGGKAVTGVQLTYDMPNNRLTLSGGNMVWPAVTFPTPGPRYAVLYVGSPLPATAQPLVAYIDFGENVAREDEPFYINWPPSGILTMAVP